MRSMFLIRVLPLVAAALFLAPNPARAWHDVGHMVTAQIAYDELSDDARDEVDRLIGLLSDLSERDHAVTAAVWADDLKRQGLEAFNTWHYINLPFAAEGTAAPPSRQENVVWAIDQAATTLRGDAGDLAKALMLRLLIHFVGDVHQPLHCVSRVTAEQPEGDRGGNDFPLAGEEHDLHAFWDSGAGALPSWDGGAWRPMVRRLASELTRSMPKSALPGWSDPDPEAWARESLDLAITAAYDGIAEGAEPTPEYTARAREIVRRRLVLGGYRLGALLNDVFAARPAPTETDAAD
ncbi:MAG: hypothetical protein GY719_09460 [bacterium]|nr:hypothetical protein [bacterium]